MEGRIPLSQPGLKLTSISRAKIGKMLSADIIIHHERLHDLYKLGKELEDVEVCLRAKRAHYQIRHEMIERGINHPYIDEMDGELHAKESSVGLDGLDQEEEESQSQPVSHDDGIMLAFFVPEDLSKVLHERQGEKKKDLHLTLACLGKVGDWDKEALEKLPGTISVFAANSRPMEGEISGMGRFAASEHSDNKDVVYYSVDIPALPQWRQSLVEWIEDAGFIVSTNHGYTPHITVKYVEPNESYTLGVQDKHPVKFSEMRLNVGDQVWRFPLASLHNMRPMRWADRLVASQERLHESRTGVLYSFTGRPSVRTNDVPGVPDSTNHGSVCDIETPILEAEVENHLGGLAPQNINNPGTEIIYGVLAVPDEADLDGTVLSQEVISKACSQYSNSMQPDENHQDVENPGLDVADSFLAPEGYELNGQPVKPGSWVVGIRTSDPEVMEKVRRGEYKGLSMEGAASVSPRKILESVAKQSSVLID